jgi:hypothetical protein
MKLAPTDNIPDYHNSNSNLNGDVDSETALQRIRTAGSISISPELFEKLYLSPQNKVAGELRKTFGNPTPLYVHSNICHKDRTNPRIAL